MTVSSRAQELLDIARLMSNDPDMEDDVVPWIITMLATNNANLEEKMDEMLAKMDEIITAINGISLVVP